MDFYDWKPYVSVAARRREAARALAGLAKAGRTLAPVRTEGRKIAATFWGKAWCENLERYSDFANRLPRGRSYVRNGSVIDLQISSGTVAALVSGSDIYDVRIDVAPVAAARWHAICRDCTGAIASLVELLQGRLSSSVMSRLCEPKTGLFPAPKEISFQCSCPDWAWMCKHVAAVLYGVGARLDTRADLLFVLRRVQQEDLIAKAADGGLQRGTRGPANAKVLDAGDLSQIFGIDIVEPEAPEGARRRAKAAAPVERARAFSRGRAGGARGSDGRTAASAPAPAGVRTSGASSKAAAERATTGPSSPMSATARAAVSARMRRYWAERRKERAAAGGEAPTGATARAGEAAARVRKPSRR